MPLTSYLERVQAYRHFIRRIRGAIYLRQEDLNDLDERMIEILSTTMREVAHFKLEGLPEDQAEHIIDQAWELFAEHCKTERPWQFVDALLEECLDRVLHN